MSKLMERAAELMQSVNEFGPTHIITADGNVDDVHIEMVEKIMEKEGATDDERELIALLKAMTVEAREKLWDGLNGITD